jgi:hypothetical protein
MVVAHCSCHAVSLRRLYGRLSGFRDGDRKLTWWWPVLQLGVFFGVFGLVSLICLYVWSEPMIGSRPQIAAGLVAMFILISMDILLPRL